MKAVLYNQSVTEDYMTNKLPPGIDENWINARAAAIHAERRNAFNFGPPPYMNEARIETPGGLLTLRIGLHVPTKNVADVLARLGEAMRRSDQPEETARAMLAYVAAADEHVASDFAVRQ
jgi:hypothetical protein